MLLLAFAPHSEAQESAIAGGLVNAIASGFSVSLIGYGITSIGLNSQAAFQTSVLTQLSEINDELDTISTQLSDIQLAIQTQTCVIALSSSSVNNALTSIATVANTYTALLQAGESTTGTVSQANINNFLNQVANGPGGSLPSISAALVAINIALQSTGNDGIIGTCESAVSSLPGTGSFGADAAFYSDPINLLQYFADYQTEAALLLVEYYNYQAFLSSPYYSATTISNGLPANEAPLVCYSPVGETATECGFARNVTEQLYVYLQNQYSADGVPYSTKDSTGNLQTGLYLAGNNTNYLFAASLEEFTNAEDIPQNNCPSVLTSSSPCGLTFSNDPANNNNATNSPFWSLLFSPSYQYETGWAPATAEMWRSVLDAWSEGNSSQTVADGLTTLGFQNAANKIILTQTEYNATPTLDTGFGVPELVFGSGLEADCFLDTNQKRSLSVQPWCYNGSSNGVSYGTATNLVSLTKTGYVEYDKSNCDAVISNTALESATDQACFYGFSDCNYAQYTSNSNYNDNTGNLNTCPNPGFWDNGVEPSWLIQSDGKVSLGGYFWPAIDVSSPTCGTNLSFGLLQPAVVRTATNFLGVPTMCGADFDLYFSDIAPRNPYQQIAVTTPAVSGSGSTSASLGPITIQLQNIYTGSTVPLTFTSATTVDLTSTSLTGVFSLTPQGPGVTNVTIPAGSSSATFYYGDSTAGTPQINADPGNMVPGVQNETITSAVPSSTEVVGSAQRVGSNKPNGWLEIRGLFPTPKGIQLNKASLVLYNLLDEKSHVGELIRANDGTDMRLPVVISAISGSTTHTVYQTGRGVTPRVKVELNAGSHKDDLGKFQIVVDDAEISSPAACSGKPSVTRLRTQIIASDGHHPDAVFNANLAWNCLRNGRLTTSSSGM